MAWAPPPFHQRWPSLQAMVIPEARLLYLPIAKVACTSLKSLMVELSGLPAERKAAILRDVHGVTDGEATGLQLKDHGAAAAEGFLAAPGWMRVAVVRGPHARLVSAYVEKFVIRRERKRVATRPVYEAVLGRAPQDADFARGIRFADFLAYVLATPPETLDPHWRPQIASFAEVAPTHLYALEHLDRLAADLSAHLGRPVRIGAQNRARAGADAVVAGVASLWPEEILRPERLAPESFYDAASAAAVARAFAADLTLHRAALARAEAPSPRGWRGWRARLGLGRLRGAAGG